MEHYLKLPLGRSLVDFVGHHALGLIVASIGIGLACRVVQYQVTPEGSQIGDRTVRLGCESMILLAPLVFSVALMKPFGVRRKAAYSAWIQLVAAAWVTWAIAMLLGLACGVLSIKLLPNWYVLGGIANVGSLLLLVGFQGGFWLSIATLVILAIESGRKVGRIRSQS